ncbi:AP2 domain transcription factor AP2VIIb-3 [Besnoitia besnoiti]|uniref:AP2 domain transcription factor AP2VIIb-3 n=1 Tax=Besnoitia besnoiti TaxID=94643 RepID=A0A2A9M5E7_BESBE|nr:AP2 domain transcription factor AP2VIIb-3 [Besnoitia besnoiti]PFH33169.1 AP2 domain transcription factor AP2VIIb-3 [Besnoitia besnoiti]
MASSDQNTQVATAGVEEARPGVAGLAVKTEEPSVFLEGLDTDVSSATSSNLCRNSPSSPALHTPTASSSGLASLSLFPSLSHPASLLCVTSPDPVTRSPTHNSGRTALPTAAVSSVCTPSTCASQSSPLSVVSSLRASEEADLSPHRVATFAFSPRFSSAALRRACALSAAAVCGPRSASIPASKGQASACELAQIAKGEATASVSQPADAGAEHEAVFSQRDYEAGLHGGEPDLNAPASCARQSTREEVSQASPDGEAPGDGWTACELEGGWNEASANSASGGVADLQNASEAAYEQPAGSQAPPLLTDSVTAATKNNSSCFDSLSQLPPESVVTPSGPSLTKRGESGLAPVEEAATSARLHKASPQSSDVHPLPAILSSGSATPQPFVSSVSGRGTEERTEAQSPLWASSLDSISKLSSPVLNAPSSVVRPSPQLALSSSGRSLASPAAGGRESSGRALPPHGRLRDSAATVCAAPTEFADEARPSAPSSSQASTPPQLEGGSVVPQRELSLEIPVPDDGGAARLAFSPFASHASAAITSLCQRGAPPTGFDSVSPSGSGLRVTGQRSGAAAQPASTSTLQDASGSFTAAGPLELSAFATALSADEKASTAFPFRLTAPRSVLPSSGDALDAAKKTLSASVDLSGTFQRAAPLTSPRGASRRGHAGARAQLTGAAHGLGLEQSERGKGVSVGAGGLAGGLLGKNGELKLAFRRGDDKDEVVRLHRLDVLRHSHDRTTVELYKLEKGRLVEELVRKAKRYPKVPGVYFDRYQQRWCVNWTEGGRRVARYYPVKVHGFDVAYQLAVNCMLSKKPLSASVATAAAGAASLVRSGAATPSHVGAPSPADAQSSRAASSPSALFGLHGRDANQHFAAVAAGGGKTDGLPAGGRAEVHSQCMRRADGALHLESPGPVEPAPGRAGQEDLFGGGAAGFSGLSGPCGPGAQAAGTKPLEGLANSPLAALVLQQQLLLAAQTGNALGGVGQQYLLGLGAPEGANVLSTWLHSQRLARVQQQQQQLAAFLNSIPGVFGPFRGLVEQLPGKVKNEAVARGAHAEGVPGPFGAPAGMRALLAASASAAEMEPPSVPGLATQTGGGTKSQAAAALAALLAAPGGGGLSGPALASLLPSLGISASTLGGISGVQSSSAESALLAAAAAAQSSAGAGGAPALGLEHRAEAEREGGNANAGRAPWLANDAMNLHAALTGGATTSGGDCEGSHDVARRDSAVPAPPGPRDVGNPAAGEDSDSPGPHGAAGSAGRLGPDSRSGGAPDRKRRRRHSQDNASHSNGHEEVATASEAGQGKGAAEDTFEDGRLSLSANAGGRSDSASKSSLPAQIGSVELGAAAAAAADGSRSELSEKGTVLRGPAGRAAGCDAPAPGSGPGGLEGGARLQEPLGDAETDMSRFAAEAAAPGQVERLPLAYLEAEGAVEERTALAAAHQANGPRNPGRTDSTRSTISLDDKRDFGSQMLMDLSTMLLLSSGSASLPADRDAGAAGAAASGGCAASADGAKPQHGLAAEAEETPSARVLLDALRGNGESRASSAPTSLSKEEIGAQLTGKARAATESPGPDKGSVSEKPAEAASGSQPHLSVDLLARVVYENEAYDPELDKILTSQPAKDLVREALKMPRVPGVWFDRAQLRWACNYKDSSAFASPPASPASAERSPGPAKRRAQYFPVKEHGFLRARLLAIQTRRRMESTYRQAAAAALASSLSRHDRALLGSNSSGAGLSAGECFAGASSNDAGAEERLAAVCLPQKTSPARRRTGDGADKSPTGSSRASRRPSKRGETSGLWSSSSASQYEVSLAAAGGAASCSPSATPGSHTGLCGASAEALLSAGLPCPAPVGLRTPGRRRATAVSGALNAGGVASVVEEASDAKATSQSLADQASALAGLLAASSSLSGALRPDTVARGSGGGAPSRPGVSGRPLGPRGRASMGTPATDAGLRRGEALASPDAALAPVSLLPSVAVPLCGPANPLHAPSAAGLNLLSALTSSAPSLLALVAQSALLEPTLSPAVGVCGSPGPALPALVGCGNQLLALQKDAIRYILEDLRHHCLNLFQAVLPSAVFHTWSLQLIRLTQHVERAQTFPELEPFLGVFVDCIRSKQMPSQLSPSVQLQLVRFASALDELLQKADAGRDAVSPFPHAAQSDASLSGGARRRGEAEQEEDSEGHRDLGGGGEESLLRRQGTSEPGGRTAQETEPARVLSQGLLATRDRRQDGGCAVDEDSGAVESDHREAGMALRQPTEGAMRPSELLQLARDCHARAEAGERLPEQGGASLLNLALLSVLEGPVHADGGAAAQAKLQQDDKAKAVAEHAATLARAASGDAVECGCTPLACSVSHAVPSEVVLSSVFSTFLNTTGASGGSKAFANAEATAEDAK